MRARSLDANFTTIRAARAALLLDAIRHAGRRFWLDRDAYVMLAYAGLTRRAVDVAIDDLAETGLVRIAVVHGVVAVEVVER